MLAQNTNSSIETKNFSSIVPGLVVLPAPKAAVQPHPGLTRQQATSKRLFDIAVSICALIAFFPVMAIIALAIKLTSPGPVLFKQERVGQHGKIFKIYKFRSMVNNAEKLQHLVNETNADIPPSEP